MRLHAYDSYIFILIIGYPFGIKENEELYKDNKGQAAGWSLRVTSPRVYSRIESQPCFGSKRVHGSCL
jgi:hypothetical protein